MKPTYSVSQFNSLGKCGEQYRLYNVVKMSPPPKKDNYFLGTVVGTTIQSYVASTLTMTDEERYERNRDVITTLYNEALFNMLVSLGTPQYLAANTIRGLLQEHETGTFDYITAQGEVVSILAQPTDILSQLDLDYIKEAQKPSFKWAYKPLDARVKDDRSLVKFTSYLTCVMNGIDTLYENNFLNGLIEVFPEYKIDKEGTYYNLTGFLDLLLKYQSDSGETFYKIIELKTSKPKSTGLLSRSECEADANFVKRDKQCQFYDDWARTALGSEYRGLYYMNTSYKDHIIPYNKDEMLWHTTVQNSLIAMTMIENNLFLPCCGTGTTNLMANSCEFAAICQYIPAKPDAKSDVAKPKRRSK